MNQNIRLVSSNDHILPPCVLWVLTDGKPGHRNQLLGLVNALQRKRQCRVVWIDIPQHPFGIWNWVCKSPFSEDHPAADHSDPDWILAAGHKTHLSLLMYKRRYPQAKSIVLMKPSLPVSWFDACVIPEHDKPVQRPSVFVTSGVLNTMEPVESGRDESCGVFLIGGESTHYEWDSQQVVQQVVTICRNQPSVHWQLTNSRRTPKDFMASLQQLNLANLTLNPVEETSFSWVKIQLEQAGQVWVTCDSVSMVFESITAAAATGLLPLNIKANSKKGGSRVVNAMREVLAKKQAAEYEQWDLSKPLIVSEAPLWEADRAANWLLDCFPEKG